MPTDQPNTAAGEAMGGVPEGWKLVPVLPTDEMTGAGNDKGCCVICMYRAMLAAAPPPPANIGADSPMVREKALVKPLAALRRCAECWDDSQGTDVPRPMMNALVELGWLERVGRKWATTDLGTALLATPGDGGSDG